MATAPTDLQNMANSAADQFGVPRAILSALIDQESGWNPWAFGSKGEIGLMQLMPATATSLGINAYDAQQNISGGTSFLKSLFDKFGDWRKALAAYNSGSPTSTAGLKYADAVLKGAQAISPGAGSSTTTTPPPAPQDTRSAFEKIMDSIMGVDPGAAAGAAAGAATGATAAGATPDQAQAAAMAAAAAQQGGLPLVGKYVIIGVVSVAALLLGLIALSRDTRETVVPIVKKGIK